jgi:hypothetical protein
LFFLVFPKDFEGPDLEAGWGRNRTQNLAEKLKNIKTNNISGCTGLKLALAA